MADTSIEWTDATWNPVAGCSIVSAGCTNCYAMRMAARLEAMGVQKYRGLTRKSGGRSIWSGRVRIDESALGLPKRWKKPRHIFVNSMSDLFHEHVPFEFVRRVWAVMADARQHTYQVLTKRPERMQSLLSGSDLPVLKNVWLGTSVENSDVVGRLEHLRRTPAAVRFASFEPLIGSVSNVDLKSINWVIAGGESGPRARPMEEEWVDELLELCERSDVKFFFKQWGGKNKKAAGRRYRGRTWDDRPSMSM